MRRAYEAREGGWGARWRFRIRCHGDRDRSPGLRLPQISRRLSSLVQDGRHRKTKGDCVRLKPPLALAAVGAGVGPPPRERRRLSRPNRFHRSAAFDSCGASLSDYSPRVSQHQQD
ncbi:hypothetical protein HPB52_016033 [Rhipicephalus sanguineus]|uniref:Uncharacterized protein n=1 Tax=Rhipicephalus sanguineus TaxID=34632 RepID=A0A9D4TAT3_RHISA|nr:hypothetical protein HPB52_016033 [Rhipicephalus sanguineus]